jgi:hypothetical protein
VDDTFVIWLSTERNLHKFQEHLNQRAPTIRFTLEVETENKLPFLDVLVLREGAHSLSFTVFRKKTNSGRFLNFNSCHPISVKAGVVKSLFHRAGKICSPNNLLMEQKTLTRIFRQSNYPTAFIRKFSVQREKCFERNRPTPIASIILPYVPGVSERLANILRSANVRTILKPAKSIRRLLSTEKPKKPILDAAHVVYRISCTNCSQVYIGETGRRVESRLREHRYSSSAVTQHMVTKGHIVDFDSVEILHFEQNWFKRRIKEAVRIDQANTFNGCCGLEMSDVWKFGRNVVL